MLVILILSFLYSEVQTNNYNFTMNDKELAHCGIQREFVVNVFKYSDFVPIEIDVSFNVHGENVKSNSDCEKINSAQVKLLCEQVKLSEVNLNNMKDELAPMNRQTRAIITTSILVGWAFTNTVIRSGGLVTGIIALIRESKLEDAYEQDYAKIKDELERFQSIGAAQEQVQSDIQKLMNATEARDEVIKEYVFKTINKTHISFTETERKIDDMTKMQLDMYRIQTERIEFQQRLSEKHLIDTIAQTDNRGPLRHFLVKEDVLKKAIEKANASLIQQGDRFRIAAFGMHDYYHLSRGNVIWHNKYVVTMQLPAIDRDADVGKAIGKIFRISTKPYPRGTSPTEDLYQTVGLPMFVIDFEDYSEPMNDISGMRCSKEEPNRSCGRTHKENMQRMNARKH